MKIFKKRSLQILIASLFILLVVIVVYINQFFKKDLIESEIQSQQKIARTIEQSLNLFFRTLVFITESTASNKAFDFERNHAADSVRFNEITKQDMLKGFNILENKSNHSELWQVYKGLPEIHNGHYVGLARREVVRNILANNPELHYAFEMDINGDLVFLEPYATQVAVSSFNYGFRDYLKLSKAHKRTVISEGYLSHDKAKTQILTVASPIFDTKGEIKRVFAVSISSKAIKEKIFLALKDTIEGLDDGYLILVDRHGHTIASSSPGMIYSPMVNSLSDESDIGNLRNLSLLKKIKWNDDTFEKGNLWERTTKSWDVGSLSNSYSGVFNFKESNQLGTLYPISVLNNEKSWGIIVSSSLTKIENKINSILISVIFIWCLLSLTTLAVTINLINRNENLERKLLEDKKSLQDLNAQIAHDIRSPASIVKKILERDSVGPEDRAHLRALTRRILDISNQILGLKLSHDDLGEANVVGIINEIVKEKRLQFESFPKVILSSQIDLPPLTTVIFPPVELSRILSNLINNSFEALLDYEGSIEIKASVKKELLEILVEDNGVGIHKESLDKILSGHTSKASGRGIGLSTSRDKVLKAGGKFEVKSNLGVGTRITIELPITASSSDLMTVLLDDDRYIRLSWENEFKKAGLNLKTYSSPEQLLAELHQFNFNTTFILDTCNYSPSYISLIEELKRFDSERIYIYSGFDKASILEKNLPFSNILSKDFDLRLLLQ